MLEPHQFSKLSCMDKIKLGMDQNVSWKVARFYMKGLLFYPFTRERNCLAITDNKFLKVNYTLQHVDEKTYVINC